MAATTPGANREECGPGSEDVSWVPRGRAQGRIRNGLMLRAEARRRALCGRGASDQALLKANDTIRKMFAYRHDILKALIADKNDPAHAGHFGTVYFGILPASSPDCEISGCPRFDVR